MAVTIKVEWGAAAKAYRFNTDQTFVEVIKSVKEKTGFVDDIKELGVYQPADGMRPGRWLRLDKTLAYYDLKNNVRQRNDLSARACAHLYRRSLWSSRSALARLSCA